jgi:FkbM family methyltransferase
MPKVMFEHIGRLKSFGYKPNIVIDIGAYVGAWTEQVLSLFPNAHFLLFEAQQSKIPNLDRLSQKHHNVSYNNVLLGAEQREKVVFFEMETGSSVFEENTDYKRERITLPMTTLDLQLATVELKGSCLMKLDVQGSELEVLSGATKTLDHVDVILIEASVLAYNEGAPLINDIFAFMKQIGFVLFDICDEKRLSSKILLQVDLIFVRENFSLRNNIDLSK